MTNPSPDRVEELTLVAIRLARGAVSRDPIFKTAEDNHGRAIESAIYRMANSEIARCYLRLVAAQSESESVTVMREALEKCRDKFAEYAEIHRRKIGSKDAATPAKMDAVLEKVERNREMADICSEALTRIGCSE